MRKLISLLCMALYLMAQTTNAQLIAEWKLQEDMVGNPTSGNPIPLNNASPGFEGWDISNCSGVFDNKFGPSFQINSGGHATTPAISGLKTSDAYLRFYYKSDNTSNIIRVSVIGNGTLKQGGYDLINRSANTGWAISNFVHLSNADSNTRLRFSADDGAFKLMAITLSEWGYFYETFDNMGGTKGVSDFTDASSDDSAPTNLLYEKDKGELYNAYLGRKCVYVDNRSSYYKIKIDASSWGNDAILSFRAAGMSDGTGSVTLTSTPSVLKETSVTPVAGEWNRYKIRMDLKGKSLSTLTLNFKGSQYFLDDVHIAPVPAVGLAESTSNDDVLQTWNGEIANVTLSRTLRKNIWNTLCVPFDVDQTVIREATGYDNGAIFKTLDHVENGVFYFTSVEPVPAGTPFLIKLANYDLTSDKVFRAVKIKTTTPQQTVDANGYGFYGTFNPVNLTTDGTNVFLAADQKLYVPAAGQNTMNGLRAFFVVPKGSASRAMVSFSDDAQAVVLPPADDQEPAVVRNLLGQPVTPVGGRLQPGCYVVNGRKVIIK